MTQTQKAINWLLRSPKRGPQRTQAQAAERFGMSQAVISRAMKRLREEQGVATPDARRQRRKS